MDNQSMYNHNKAQQSKNRVHISWDILYIRRSCKPTRYARFDLTFLYTNVYHEECPLNDDKEQISSQIADKCILCPLAH